MPQSKNFVVQKCRYAKRTHTKISRVPTASNNLQTNFFVVWLISPVTPAVTVGYKQYVQLSITWKQMERRQGIKFYLRSLLKRGHERRALVVPIWERPFVRPIEEMLQSPFTYFRKVGILKNSYTVYHIWIKKNILLHKMQLWMFHSSLYIYPYLTYLWCVLHEVYMEYHSLIIT